MTKGLRTDEQVRGKNKKETIKMELGDIVNINASDGGYWKGKITKISDSWRHTFKDGSEAVTKYSKPIATVRGTDGAGYAAVNSSDLKRQGNEWFEKKIGEK